MRSLFRLLGVAVFASAALSVTSVASAAPINTMVSFGDSLSDPGNALFLTNPITYLGTVYTGTEFLASQGRAVDPSGHFSNGPTAVEYLASSLGLATSKGWATPFAQGVATNYAVGGALTGPLHGGGAQHLDGYQNPFPVTELALTGITSQVARFLASAPPFSFDPATTLFTIQGGGNDIFSANTLGLTGQDMTDVVVTATAHLHDSIAALAFGGARRILWMTLPDLSLTPNVQIAESQFPNQGIAEGAFNLTIGFNNALRQRIAGLDLFLNSNFNIDLDLIEVDTAGFMRTFADPALSLTAPPCVFTPADLPGCDGRFFFDTVHPTTAAHAAFANVLIRAVPEPQSLALVLLALVGVAVGQRRRRQPAALLGA